MTRLSRRNTKQFRKDRNYVKIKHILLIVLYAFTLLSGIEYANGLREKNYNKSIDYMLKGNYILASEGFEELHIINYKRFPKDALCGKDYDRYYKDSAVLYAYSQAIIAYNSDDSENASVWIKALPDGYEGIMSEEICNFKNSLKRCL